MGAKFVALRADGRSKEILVEEESRVGRKLVDTDGMQCFPVWNRKKNCVDPKKGFAVDRRKCFWAVKGAGQGQSKNRKNPFTS